MGGKRDNESPWAAAGRYASLALMMPLSTFVGYLMGYLLDRAFHTRFLFLVFLVLGFAAGIIELMRELNPKDGT